MYILNDINNWKCLKQIDGYGNNIYKNKITKTHYRYIYNKYLYWIKKNVFYNYIYHKNTNIFVINMEVKMYQ